MTTPEFLTGRLPDFGYAVDVGASDGIWLSNSKFLEDKGWTVLCVEPNPLLAKKGMENRKMWKQAACGDSDGEMAAFFIMGEYPHSSYSSLHPENKHNPIQDSDSWNKLMEKSKPAAVIVRTLDSLLAEHQFPRLDFLTIDVEGSELSVLRGIDLGIWKPRIIVLEAWSDEKLLALIEQLNPFGYSHIGNVEYDHIFERGAMKSYSQCGQDLFCYAMTEGKKNGFYLDIGCNHPVAINNTYLFESEFGWDGILVDVLSGGETRKGRFFQCDAANPTPELRKAYDKMPQIVDFLSLDVDDATLATFHTLPWSSKRFRVCCIEHDTYRQGPSVRDKLRTEMFAMGYSLVGMDVCVRFPDSSSPLGSFEDWWCHPCLVESELIQKFTCSNKEWSEIVRGI